MVCWATETSMNNIFNMGNLLLALGILVSISAFVCLYYAYKEDEREIQKHHNFQNIQKQFGDDGIRTRNCFQ